MGIIFINIVHMIRPFFNFDSDELAMQLFLDLMGKHQKETLNDKKSFIAHTQEGMKNTFSLKSCTM